MSEKDTNTADESLQEEQQASQTETPEPSSDDQETNFEQQAKSAQA